jgi:hypothetical protein
MSDTTTNAIKIVSYGAGVVFSLALFVFSLVMYAEDTAQQFYLTIAMSMASYWLPSPIQLGSFTSSSSTTAATPTTIATAATADIETETTTSHV